MGASANSVTPTRGQKMSRDGVQSDEAELEKTAINSNVYEIRSSILERREYSTP